MKNVKTVLKTKINYNLITDTNLFSISELKTLQPFEKITNLISFRIHLQNYTYFNTSIM